MVCYLKSEDPAVQCAAAKALYQLSRHPENCVTMHAAGAVKYLVDLVSSSVSSNIFGLIKSLDKLMEVITAEVRSVECKYQYLR